MCIELIQEIREIPGVSGVHVMAYRQEELVADIIGESGVLRDRKPWRRLRAETIERAARRCDSGQPSRSGQTIAANVAGGKLEHKGRRH